MMTPTILWLSGSSSLAQDDLRNFRKPILVVETEGHHAPIRGLVWRNAFSLLSAGQDKVVKAWDLGDGARLANTIRPMMWRGLSGTIYSMALSPKPDDQGNSYLALAGIGILSNGGDITVYRYPGANRDGTGEPVARLFAPGPNDPGHRNNVYCLAFDPTGKILASGDAQKTLILWELDGSSFRHRRTIEAHRGAITSVAFSPDGSKIITAGGSPTDGEVKVWDTAAGTLIDRFPGTAPPSGINTLAVHPGGEIAVIGREDGALFQLDLRNLGRAPIRLATLPSQGPVERVAFSADGTRLAVSLVADRKAAEANPISVSCDVEIREFPGGAVVHRHAGIPGLIYSAAFSPDGGRLAYAGGNSQAIFLRDTRNPQAPPTEVKGQGTTIMTVGFTADSRTVAFSRGGPVDGASEGFDLNARAYRPVEREEVHGPILQHDGWTLRVSMVPSYHLEAVHRDGRTVTFPINMLRETTNLWSFTIIPGNAEKGHPRATIAVGADSGVLVFDLESGRRTRMFAGHSGAVTALAPSPDGRWLASGSVDQTIRINPLSQCDVMPGFGAGFRQEPDASWIVDKVDPRGYAAAMGLLIGDRLLGAVTRERAGNRAYKTSAELGQLVTRIDSLMPNEQVGLFVRRSLWIPGFGYHDVDLPGLVSSKRDNPAFNLLVGLDKEWVLWTPRGFYDTSIEGDSRLLGWQINPPFNPSLVQTPQPTDYLPIASFANKLIRGDILDRIWNNAGVEMRVEGGVPAVGANPPPPPSDPVPAEIVRKEQPPQIEFAAAVEGVPPPAPGETWKVQTPRTRLKLLIKAIGDSKVKERLVVIDDRLVSAKLGQPAVTVGEEFEVHLTPDHPVRVAVKAVNDSDNPRSAWIDILYAPPAPPPPPPPPARRPKLVMVGIGVNEFQNAALPKLEFASDDVTQVSEFISRHLVAPSGAFGSRDLVLEGNAVLGNNATAAGIVGIFERLQQQSRNREIVKGDTVVIFLESHVLEIMEAGGKKSTSVAPSDIGKGNPPAAPIVSTHDLSERLGALADEGCRVVLFLDGVHLPRSGRGTFKSTVDSWVRDLQRNRRVITFVASKYGPAGDPDRQERLGLFAKGILRAFEGTQSAAKAGESLSIDAFRAAVVERVREYSNRRQEVGLYLPNSVPPRTQFAHP